MWDEEINKKIKDAADQYHPAYDDAAWNKMEQMLNEHLPRKKDRRRIIYFIPFIALLAGILFFVLFNKNPAVPSKNPGNNLLKNTARKLRGENQKVASLEITAPHSPVKSIHELQPGAKT